MKYASIIKPKVKTLCIQKYVMTYHCSEIRDIPRYLIKLVILKKAPLTDFIFTWKFLFIIFPYPNE